MNGTLVPMRNWIIAASRSDAEPLDLVAAAQHEVEDHSGEHHRGEHVRDEPDAQGDGESLDGSRTESEQEERADQRGDVGVQDGPERAVVAELHGLADRLLVAKLLPDALEDQN